MIRLHDEEGRPLRKQKEWKKKEILFEGKGTIDVSFVGTDYQPRKRKDRFGIILRGTERCVIIDTKYGQLSLAPYKYGNKNLRITIEEI